MKPLLVVVMVLLSSLLCGSAAAEDKSADALTLRVTQVSLPGTVTVEMENSSKEPIRVFRDSNSWGAARWRLLLIRDGKLETFFQILTEIFTMNIPEFREITGGGHFEQKLDLNGGDWHGVSGKKFTFKSGDTVIIVYDVPITTEALDRGVWHGTAAALTTVQ